jgi:De-etiolated protein 1 Det1
MLKRLYKREEGGNVRNLEFYSSIYPCLSQKLQTSFTPKQFSPCGRYLISFGLDQVVIQSYCYDLPQMLTVTHTLDLKDVISTDFSLFSTCTEYVIFATARNTTSTRSNPSSLTIIPNLDDITFWLVHLESGKIRDKLEFKSDYIYLSNHSGVSLYDNSVAITSVQHQTIYFYKLVDGRFVSFLNLGWWNRDDDELFMIMHKERVARFDSLGCDHGQDCFGHKPGNLDALDSVNSFETIPNDEEEPGLIMSGLKQRMLSFLYRKAMQSPNPQALNHFYLTFGYFRDLIMWRIQFLDSGLSSINTIRPYPN